MRCAALAVSPFASSQSPTPATPHEQVVQPAPQTDETPGFGDNAAQRREGYTGFLHEMAGEERYIQQQLGQGHETPRSLVNWAKLLRIREDEEQVMHTIAADAGHRIEEINDRDYASAMERQQNPSEENVERFLALNKELARQRKEILDETIAKLRQELGEEDFKKLDAYVYRTSNAGITAMQAKHREKDADQKQRGEDSNPAPAKEPQQ